MKINRHPFNPFKIRNQKPIRLMTPIQWYHSNLTWQDGTYKHSIHGLVIAEG
jgi:hypothetical protein